MKNHILLVLVAILICILLFVGLPYCFDSNLILGLVMLIITLVFGFILFLYLSSKEQEYNKEKLENEFKYIFKNSHLSWILGLWLATLISSVIIMFFGISKVGHIEFNPSAFDIVGLYTSTILGMLAIRSFFDKLHPITDEIELIEKITKDLDRAKSGAHIWFSFPAFNLGQFRVESGVVNGDKKLEKYLDALTTKINNEKFYFNGICYSQDNIEKLYEQYAIINKPKFKQEHQKLIHKAKQKCIDKANLFVNSLKESEKNNQNGKYYEMNPESPLESFIIIGSIVYTIQAWGMPIYNGSDFEDPFKGDVEEGEDKKLVKLIAYRQENKYLSKTIIQRTKSLLESSHEEK